MAQCNHEDPSKSRGGQQKWKDQGDGSMRKKGLVGYCWLSRFRKGT